jgi:putative phosphoesterase
MECVIISDTHGNYPLAAEAIIKAGPVDRIFHLGDDADDAAMLEHIISKRVDKIAGNCDVPGKYPREISVELENTLLLITHGDRYKVKSGLTELYRHAVSKSARVVLYGHTHQAAVEEIDGILFINPGSLQRGEQPKSYARLSLSREGPKAEIIVIIKEKI